MACENCNKPRHEQYKGYLGYWRCLEHPDGKCILKTPVKDWGNYEAHNQMLAAAETPKWCPKKE